jgi:hypothetical protein
MSRLKLSEWLHAICDHVYYQPPSGHEIVYPCIIYERRSGDTLFANDIPYRFTYSYTITVIDPDPDSTIPEEVAKLPMCKMDRVFSTENLYHTVFILYL